MERKILKDGECVPQNLPLAVKYITASAEQGNVDAQYNIGCLLRDGIGCQQNYAQALYWFQKAVQQGNDEAYYNLAVMHLEGKGAQRNPTYAAQIFEELAAKGLVEAQYNLGVLYLDGNGAPQNSQRAIALFQMAAQKGDASSQYNLGIIYGHGCGVSVDLEKAKRWFELAAQNGDREAVKKIQEIDILLENSKESQNHSSGGCYIATAVYGSYNCPQVRIMRRYRDSVLMSSWYGRLFIKFYYALSPICIRVFGRAEWFQKFWRNFLDRIIVHLQKKGFADTPYDDKV